MYHEQANGDELECNGEPPAYLRTAVAHETETKLEPVRDNYTQDVECEFKRNESA